MYLDLFILTRLFSIYFSCSNWKKGLKSQMLIMDLLFSLTICCFPGSSADKASACSVGDLGLIPALGRSSGEGNGPISSSTDRGVWQAAVHWVTKSLIRPAEWLSRYFFSLPTICQVFFFFSFLLLVFSVNGYIYTEHLHFFSKNVSFIIIKLSLFILFSLGSALPNSNISTLTFSWLVFA